MLFRTLNKLKSPRIIKKRVIKNILLMLLPGMDEDEDGLGEEKLDPGHGEAVDKAPVLRAPVLS